MTIKQQLLKQAREWHACPKGIKYLKSLPDDVTMESMIAICDSADFHWWLTQVHHHTSLDEWDRLYGEATRERIIDELNICSDGAEPLAEFYCRFLTVMPEDVFAELPRESQLMIELWHSSKLRSKGSTDHFMMGMRQTSQNPRLS